MKIEIIRTYDIGSFSSKLEELYKTGDVERVDTSTEVLKTRGEDLIYYVAIVFIKDHAKLPDPKVEAPKIDLDTPIMDLNMPSGAYNAICRYNRRSTSSFSWEHVEPINNVKDLIEAFKTRRIRCIYGLGPLGINKLRDMLCQAGFEKELEEISKLTLDSPACMVEGLQYRVTRNRTIRDILQSIKDGSIYRWRNVGRLTVQQTADTLKQAGFDIEEFDNI